MKTPEFPSMHWKCREYSNRWSLTLLRKKNVEIADKIISLTNRDICKKNKRGDEINRVKIIFLSKHGA